MITLQKHVFAFTISFGTLVGTFSQNIVFGSRLPTLVGIYLERFARALGEWPCGLTLYFVRLGGGDALKII